MNAGRQLAAQLRQPRIHLGLRGRGRLRVFLADLLLDQRAADQLLERPLRRERALAHLVGIEHREPNLIVDVAGQNRVAVHHGHHAVQHHRAARCAWAQKPAGPACA